MSALDVNIRELEVLRLDLPPVGLHVDALEGVPVVLAGAVIDTASPVRLVDFDVIGDDGLAVDVLTGWVGGPGGAVTDVDFCGC